jgi:DNA-binding response OmpR family regulator
VLIDEKKMKKMILIIEDNVELRENTAEILELANYNIITAENGKVGLDMAIQDHPDLIISDIMMPEMNGFDVLTALRRTERLIHIPFVFLTARAERIDKETGLDLGADGYLAKPFDVDELLRIVSEKLSGISPAA